MLANGLILRRRFAPLEQLIAAMESVDFSARRPPIGAAAGAEVDEVARLRHAYERMLARLEDERARTASAVLQAQESERARVARDLHDEANQALTGVLLRAAGDRRGGAGPPARRAPARRGAWRRGRWRSCCGSRASCAPPRSTTSGSPPRCARSWTSSAAAPEIATRFSAERGVLDRLDADGQLVA